MDDFVVGLDLGTSAVKAVVVSARGEILRSGPRASSVSLSLNSPQPGWSEQDPEEWWRASVEAIRLVLAQADIGSSRIAGLALSGQMHGATFLDALGKVLRPAILWNDQRSSAECDLIVERIGMERLLSLVGNPALAGFTAPKLLWVREHEPELWARVAKVLLPKDYINYRLTGEMATEVSDASGTLLFDVARREWSEEVISALEISRDLLPSVHSSIDVIGEVTREAAEETGLPAGTPVVAGGADNACAALSMGVTATGTVLVSIGTSGTIVAPVQDVVDPSASLHTFCHVVPDTWYLMGVVLSAGGSLRWLRDLLGVQSDGQRDAYDVMMQEAERVPAGSRGLVFLPYLTGERSPHGDPNARGVFFGLSPQHGQAELIRSVAEGVSFGLSDCAEVMRARGVETEHVRATGGGARSQLWREILGAVLKASVSTARSETGPVIGAALLAGTGVGVFESLEEGVAELVSIGDEEAPDPNLVSAYEPYQDLYRSLYPVLKESFARLATMREGG